MTEHVKIGDVTRSEGKIPFTVEVTVDAFWERQLNCNLHPVIIKGALGEGLTHDARYGPYVSLVPEFGKINVAGVSRFLEECGDANEVKIDEGDGGI